VDIAAVNVPRVALSSMASARSKLGGDRGARPTNKQRARAIAVRQEQARTRALDLAPTVKELQEGGRCVTVGHRSRPRRARHSCYARRLLVCNSGAAAAGDHQQPLSRHRRRSRVKRRRRRTP
jgi:hypothetical protein